MNKLEPQHAEEPLFEFSQCGKLGSILKKILCIICPVLVTEHLNGTFIK